MAGLGGIYFMTEKEKSEGINETKYMTPDEVAECAEISSNSEPQIKSTQVDEEHRKTLIPQEHLQEFFQGGTGTIPEEVEIKSASEPEVKNLPSSVDLRKWVSRIDNQGSEGICTSFASIAYLAMKLAKETGVKYDLSEYFHWYNYAAYNSWTAANALAKFYQGEEKYWPDFARQGLPGWDESRLATLAAPREIKSLQEMKAWLAQGEPILLSVGLDSRYWTSPVVYGNRGEQLSGHAVLACGFVDDNRFAQNGGGYVIIQNSWGEAYGDKGFNYLTYDYFTSNRFWTQFIAFDKEIIWRPGKKPAGKTETVDLRAVVYPMFKYAEGNGPEHTAYGVTLVGKDTEKIQSVRYQDNEALPRWEDTNANKKVIGTYAQSGYPLTTAEVTLKDGRKLALEAKVP